MTKRKATVLGLGAAVVLISLYAGRWAQVGAPRLDRHSTHATNATQTITTPRAEEMRRPIYRYSVIPGGVLSSTELREAMGADPVVKRHYVDFQLRTAELTRVSQPERLYVSYRKANQIFWTSRAITVPAGELLLTDGVHFARARCGNRLSKHPPPEEAISMGNTPPEDLDAEAEMPPPVRESLTGLLPAGLDPSILFPPAWIDGRPVAPAASVPAEPAVGVPPIPGTGLFSTPVVNPLTSSPRTLVVPRLVVPSLPVPSLPPTGSSSAGELPPAPTAASVPETPLSFAAVNADQAAPAATPEPVTAMEAAVGAVLMALWLGRARQRSRVSAGTSVPRL